MHDRSVYPVGLQSDGLVVSPTVPPPTLLCGRPCRTEVREESGRYLGGMASRSTRYLLYWGCQLLGWMFYVSFFGLLAWLQDSYDEGQGALLVITMLVGLASSHVLRAVMMHMRWQEQTFLRVFPRLLLTVGVLGGLATLLQAALHDVVIRQVGPILTGGPGRLVELTVGWVLILTIWTVLYMAYHFFVRSRREEIRALRMEAADRTNQLANLRSQMNPHFMFNALNGIRALVDEDPARAKQAITQLSAILRNTMATVKRVTVPLGEELDIVRAYLDLEHMRYEERLRVFFEVDPTLVREPVPPMMLQTLVENAVKHGVANRPEGGEVRIEARRADGRLVLSITNTGRYAPGVVHGTGIGLSNTRERLQRIYGDRARLNITERKGMVVTEVELPPTRLAEVAESIENER